MLVGHIQGSWGIEVPAHRTSRSPPLPRGGRGGAVLLRVVAALPFNYCSAGPCKAACGPTPTLDSLFPFSGGVVAALASGLLC